MRPSILLKDPPPPNSSQLKRSKAKRAFRHDFDDEDYSPDDKNSAFERNAPFEDKWDQKEWNQFLENLLEWLEYEDPTDTRLFVSERQVIPGNFHGTFCYIYKGNFLPSGNSDGLYWRPSQGATPTGKRMLKRYFYSRTKSGGRIKRQISWLDGRDDTKWCVLDYRVGHTGPTRFNQIKTPNNMNWSTIVRKVNDFTNGIRTSPTYVYSNPSSTKNKRSVEYSSSSSSEEEEEEEDSEKEEYESYRRERRVVVKDPSPLKKIKAEGEVFDDKDNINVSRSVANKSSAASIPTQVPFIQENDSASDDSDSEEDDSETDDSEGENREENERIEFNMNAFQFANDKSHEAVKKIEKESFAQLKAPEGIVVQEVKWDAPINPQWSCFENLEGLGGSFSNLFTESPVQAAS